MPHIHNLAHSPIEHSAGTRTCQGRSGVHSTRIFALPLLVCNIRNVNCTECRVEPCSQLLAACSAPWGWPLLWQGVLRVLGVLPRREFRHGLLVGWPSFCPAGRRWPALLARSKPKKKSFCGAVRGLLSHRPCYPGSPARRVFCEAPGLAVVALPASGSARPQAAAAWRHRVGQTRRWVQTPNPLRGICARDEARDLKHSMCARPKGWWFRRVARRTGQTSMVL